MAHFYDARGNIYGVVAPQMLRGLGIPLPRTAAESARSRDDWSHQAVEALCSWPTGARPTGAKAHRCDGLLVGPFQAQAPFDLLIVNTDGTLAERSGNGLTIFAQALTDQALMPGPARCGFIMTRPIPYRRYRLRWNRQSARVFPGSG